MVEYEVEAGWLVPGKKELYKGVLPSHKTAKSKRKKLKKKRV